MKVCQASGSLVGEASVFTRHYDDEPCIKVNHFCLLSGCPSTGKMWVFGNSRKLGSTRDVRRESVENWDDLRTRGPEDGKIGRWRQGSEGNSLDYLVPQVQYKSPRENDFRDCLRVVEGATPGFRVQMAGMAPLPAVSKPHPMSALTHPISGTQLRGAGQTLEASIVNANSSDHDPMQCDAGRTRQAHSAAWAECAAMSVRGHRPSRNGGHPPPAACNAVGDLLHVRDYHNSKSTCIPLTHGKEPLIWQGGRG